MSQRESVLSARDRSALDELRSLLGVWFTDSPTWPPAPGVQKALRLAERAEREHAESLAVYIGQIKELARELMVARGEVQPTGWAARELRAADEMAKRPIESLLPKPGTKEC